MVEGLIDLGPMGDETCGTCGASGNVLGMAPASSLHS